MKKLIAGLLLFLSPYAAADIGSPWSTTLTPTLNAAIQTFTGTNNFTGAVNMTGKVTANTSGNDMFVSTGVLDVNMSAEGQISKWTGTYSGTSGTALPATGWFYLNYNSSGPVTTAHGLAAFGRVIMGPLVQGFAGGLEGNCWTNTTLVTGSACVGVIGHAVANNGTTTPLAPTIGVEGRAEMTTDSTGATPRTGYFSQYQNMAFRAETYGGSTATWNSTNYNFNGVVGGSNPGKIINNGPIMALAPNAQTMVAGDQVLTDGCGTVKRINAASAITADAVNPFMPPSLSTAGAANTGCLEAVVNNGANNITLPNTANFFSFGAQNQVMSTGDGMWVVNDGAEWVQIGPMQKQSGIETIKGLVMSAGTSTGTYNPGGIIDELIVSSGMNSTVATETLLYGYSVPSGVSNSTASVSISFPTRQAISIDAAGTTVNATLEEVKVYFGSTVILDSGAGNFSASSWTVHCDITQIGTGTSQIASCHFFDGTATLLNSNTAPAEASTPFIKITGTASVATLNAVKVNQVILKKE